MKGLIALVSAVAALALPTAAAADPSGPNVQQNIVASCSNGQTVVINGGTLTNQSHQSFVVGSPSIFVLNYLSATVDGATYVLFDTAPGLSGDLVTCTGTYGPYLLEVRGFFTPRSG
jgi:hypothetical protein